MKIHHVKKNQRTLDGFDSYTVIFSVGNPKDVKNVALKISQQTLFSLLFWFANCRLPRMLSTGPAPWCKCQRSLALLMKRIQVLGFLRSSGQKPAHMSNKWFSNKIWGLCLPRLFFTEFSLETMFFHSIFSIPWKNVFPIKSTWPTRRVCMFAKVGKPNAANQTSGAVTHMFRDYDLKEMQVPREAWPLEDFPYRGAKSFTVRSRSGAVTGFKI